MKTKCVLIIMFLLLVIMSCNKYSTWGPPKDHKPGRVIDGDPEPAWPGEAGMKTLEGIDSDKDGVRDDLEIFINYNYDTPDLRNAFKQYVKYEQLAMLSADDKEISNRYLHESQKAIMCIIWLQENVLKASKSTDIIETAIYNTKDRVIEFSKISKNFHGQITNSEIVRTADLKDHGKFCQFKAQKELR